MKIEQFPLIRHNDHRGYLEEVFKPEMLPENHREFGQCFLTTAKPGITKGNHWHHHKYELFYLVKGEATVYFKDLDSKNSLYEFFCTSIKLGIDKPSTSLPKFFLIFFF